MDLTSNEEDLIKVLRELKPFEKVEIQKDANGKPDFYILKREQKIFFTNYKQ